MNGENNGGAKKKTLVQNKNVGATIGVEHEHVKLNTRKNGIIKGL